MDERIFIRELELRKALSRSRINNEFKTNYMKLSMNKILAAPLIMLFLLCQQSSYAQITITTNPADISQAMAGQNFDAVISATAANGNLVSLSVSTDIPAGSGLIFDSANPPEGTPLHLHGNNPATGSWFFSVLATATGEAPVGQDFTIQVRRPIDLYLVLDKSGSMTIPVTGGAESRWDALKSGVSSFFSNYQPNLSTSGGLTGDQLGIRMFGSTDAPPVNAPFNVNNYIPVTPSMNLATILDGDSPGGSTAMGPALLSASNFLFPGGDNGHKKAILLFTDGEQNVPPNVVAASGANPTVSGTDITNGDRIQIHTIGLGVPGPATQTLYHIAHESGAPQTGISNIANSLSTTPPDLNLGSYLLAINNQLFSGSTPQFVDVKRNNFKQTGNFFGAQETFTVSKNIETIFINFLCSVTNEARVAGIVKDSLQISLFDSSYVKQKRGNGWQTFIISVSGIKKKIPSFKSEGNWTVNVVTGTQSSASYILSLTVDDHNSEMIGTTTQTKELIVGGTLPLSVDFTKFGKPVTNATVMAVIAKPGDDLGDLLARTNVSVKIDTTGDADNPGTQKLNQLLKDSAFVKKMLDSNHAVNLTFDASQDKYVGEFKQLDVSGVYQVAYIVSVNDTSLGEIRRYAEESVYIRFPEVDLEASGINLIALENGATLTFRPIGINGKYIGPGWGNAIKIDGDNTKITSVVDNLDGSYTIVIQGSLTENVTVSIGGAEIYTGPLEDIEKGGAGSSGSGDIWKQWWFWLILIVIIIVIWLGVRKKNTP